MAYYDLTQTGAEVQAILNKADTAYQPMTTATISGTTLTAAVNTYYVGTNIGTLAVTLPTPTGTNVQSIVFYLETGATPNVTFSHGTTPVYSDGYQIDANAKCEINALWNGSVWVIGQLKLT